MATGYSCPVTDCLWTHLDKAEFPVPGWEPWAKRVHSFTYTGYGSDEVLRAHHLTVEKVLYAHLETHSSFQWMETLRHTRSEDGVPVG